jgi:TolA-binding protein
MSDPRRLLEGGGSNIERDLLEAAQTELPDASAKRRAATALAIGAATASVWPTAAYATAKASKAGMPLLIKIFAAGAIGAGTLGTAAYVITKPEPPAATEVAPPVATNAGRFTGKPRVAEPAPEPAAPADPAATAETPEPTPAPEPRRSPPASPAAASSISEEIRVLDEARRAIAAGDSAAAKRALEQHRRQYPRGALAEEAVLLQIESLARQGKRGKAKALAERFRASHPNSPHLRRIESVLAEP